MNLDNNNSQEKELPKEFFNRFSDLIEEYIGPIEDPIPDDDLPCCIYRAVFDYVESKGYCWDKRVPINRQVQ